MDIDKRRAARERIRRNRAVRAGVHKVLGKQTIRHTAKVTDQTDSYSDSTDTKNVDSSDEESTSNDSRNRKHALPEERYGSSQVEIGEPSRGQAMSFDFTTMVPEFKTSPASSVASHNSFQEDTYSDLRLPSAMPSVTDIESRLQGPSTYSPQEPPWMSSSTDSNVLRVILESMQKLAHEQSKLTIAVNNMSAVLERLTEEGPRPKREPFEKQYKLPFTNKEDFLKFDLRLAEDEDCRTALVHGCYQKYDIKKTVTKNITAILRKFVTRDVALTYTAQKFVAGKAIFKDTTFSACILETIDCLADDHLIGPLPDNEYYAHLGAVLSNAKDWGVTRGDRSGRKRRNVE